MRDVDARAEVDKRRGIHGIIGASVLIVLMSIGVIAAFTRDPVDQLVAWILAVSLTITCIGMKIMIGKTNQTTAALRSFSRYMPASVALRIMQSKEPATLTSEGKQLAVLFTDLADFDKHAKDMDATQLREMLDSYFAALLGAFDASGATIDKLMGDSVLAYWEEPSAAITGVRDAQTALAKLNAERKSAGKPHFETSYGLSFGEVQIGNFGAPQRMNHTIYGDAVNTAALLTSAASNHASRVLITDEFADAVGDQSALQSAGAVEIRNRGEIKAWTLA